MKWQSVNVSVLTMSEKLGYRFNSDCCKGLTLETPSKKKKKKLGLKRPIHTCHPMNSYTLNIYFFFVCFIYVRGVSDVQVPLYVVARALMEY